MRRLAESPVVKALAKSYVDASRKDKVSVLSTIANQFTCKALNTYVFAALHERLLAHLHQLEEEQV